MDINSLRIGRSVDNDIVINEQRVSSHHARLVKTAQGLIIEDFGSRNGVFVNNERVQRKLVRIGDIVQLSQNAMLDWGHPAIECLLSGEGAGVQEDSFTIGRAPGNDMVINDPRISFQHAKIVRTPDGLRIEDVGSQNGIFVSGEKVTSSHVYAGIEVRLGQYNYLNWNDSNLRSWLGQSAAMGHASSRTRKAIAFWIAGSVAAMALVVSLVLLLPGDRIRSRAIAEPGKTTRIGIDGIVATIPGDAVLAPVEISVAETEPVSGMQNDALLATPVFTFTDPVSQFQSAITVDIDFVHDVNTPGTVSFPAYWDENNRQWVQVFAARQDGVLNVTTDHLSSWSVISVQEIVNPLTTLLPVVTDVAFAPVGFSWEFLMDDYLEILARQDLFFGDNLYPVAGVEVTGPQVASIQLDGERYSVVSTNIPLRRDSGYGDLYGQPAVQNSQGQWVTDQSVIFDVLYAYKCRQFLERTDTQRMADTFQQTADDLQTMYFWHNAAGAVDAMQMVLSEVLSHGVTGVPFSITELISSDVLNAIQGAICRSEMIRFGNQLERISSALRNYNSGSLSDSEVVELITEVEDAHNRVDPLAELSQSTFPAYEENWFKYTAGRVFGDFLGLIISEETDQLAALAHSSTTNPAMLQAASDLISAAGDFNEAAGILEIVSQILNLQGDTPLWEYYRDTHDFRSNFVHTYNISKDIVYLEITGGIGGEPNPRDPDMEITEIEINGRFDRSQFPARGLSYLYAINQDQVPLGFRSTEIIVEESTDGASWRRASFDFTAVGQTSRAVNISIVMDYSGSMSSANAIGSMESAVSQFINLLGGSDKVEIIKFATTVSRVFSLSTNHGAALAAIVRSSSNIGNGTSLWDAVVTACNSSSLSAVVVLTDGVDGGSGNTSGSAISSAQSRGISVFTIGLGSSINSSELGSLASSTGGTYYHSPSSSELSTIYSNIGGVFDNTYLIEWTPNQGVVSAGGMARIRLYFQGTHDRVEDSIVFQY